MGCKLPHTYFNPSLQKRRKKGLLLNISLNNKTFISVIFLKYESLVINTSAWTSKEVANLNSIGSIDIIISS